jgi:hypothetical protein
MNKKMFDLIALEFVGLIFGPLMLARVWSTKRLITPPAAGIGYSTAKVVKASTA